MKRENRYKLLLFPIILFTAIMSGCAFGTRNVTLNPIVTSLALDASGQRVIVQVRDARDPSLKPVVGHVKNGFGMKTADVVADKEVSLWVRDNIMEELRRSGAMILSDTTILDNMTSRISVDLLVCYAQAYWNYGGEVSVTLTVRKNDKDLIKERTYSGKATLGTNWGASSSSYQKVLELAMEDMLQKIMPDIIEAIKS